MKKNYLLAAMIFLTLSSYAATGSASDGALFMLVVIAILAIPLALSYLIGFIADKLKHLCK